MLGEKDHYINPLRTVTINAFDISATEVTNYQFAQFIQATHYVTDAERYKNAMVFEVGLGEFEWKKDTTAYWRFPNGITKGGIENCPNHPVTCVSYYDIQQFVKWARVRLPTLDEWETATRATSTGRYFFEEEHQINQYANIWINQDHRSVPLPDSNLYTSTVAIYAPNPYGLYDVYGNCFEFCDNNPAPIDKPVYMAFARGGSWWCSFHSCSFFNSVDIGKVNQRASFSNHGFRVVKS